MRAPDALMIAKIVEVRRLQRQAAEMRAASASATLARLRDSRAETLQSRTDEEQRWSKTIGSPSIDLHVAAGWSRAVLSQDAVIGWVDRRIGEAQDDKERANKQWHAASARVQGAEKLERAAKKRGRHRREEALVQQAADRAAGRDCHEN